MLTSHLAKILSRLAIATFVIALVGCGGGGGGSDPATSSGSTVGSGDSSGSDSPPVTVSLEWVAPTQRINGDPIAMADMGGYRVYRGSSPNDLSLVAEVEDPYTMSYSISDLDAGTYYFYVTTVDSTGVESAPSETVTITL